MRIKQLNNKPDLYGKIKIVCYKTKLMNWQVYNVKCNNRSIAVYTDLWEAIQKVKNGIYGYPKEYIAY